MYLVIAQSDNSVLGYYLLMHITFYILNHVTKISLVQSYNTILRIY